MFDGGCKKIIIIFLYSKNPTLRIDCCFFYKIPLAPMGVLAPGSAHARPSALPPIKASEKFSAHMSSKAPSTLGQLLLRERRKKEER